MLKIIRSLLPPLSRAQLIPLFLFLLQAHGSIAAELRPKLAILEFEEAHCPKGTGKKIQEILKKMFENQASFSFTEKTGEVEFILTGKISRLKFEESFTGKCSTALVSLDFRLLEARSGTILFSDRVTTVTVAGKDLPAESGKSSKYIADSADSLLIQALRRSCARIVDTVTEISLSKAETGGAIYTVNEKKIKDKKK